MKQIDNRQKQQIQMRAQQVKLHKNILNPKTKEKPELMEHPSRVPQEGDVSIASAEHAETYHAGPKAGRNDPCPCGSGKKYKKCCLDGEGAKEGTQSE